MEWVEYGAVKPNQYNPNRMTLQDRLLLRQSILEDGWTQPIVTLTDGTIVDGEQRWTTAGMPITVPDVDAIIAEMEKRQEQGFEVSESILHRLAIARERIERAVSTSGRATLASITSGLVPITRVDFRDDAHKMIATIRHNRARGQHSIDVMSEITADLKAMGLNADDMFVRLGMSREEIDRLVEAGGADLTVGAEVEGFSQAWTPTLVSALSDDDLAARKISQSSGVQEAAKQFETAKVAREKAIREAVDNEAKSEERHTGRKLTQPEKEAIRARVESSVPLPEKPVMPELRKLMFYMTVEQHDLVMGVLGDPPVDGLIALCEMAIREGWATADPDKLPES